MAIEARLVRQTEKKTGKDANRASGTGRAIQIAHPKLQFPHARCQPSPMISLSLVVLQAIGGIFEHAARLTIGRIAKCERAHTLCFDCARLLFH
jgi:hypothetical protein